jgi:carbon monoxide dehydrogenase subunit G
MDLKIPYSNLSTADEAYKLAAKLITPEYIAKWKVKAEVVMDDKNKSITAKGKGFTLVLTFKEYAAEVKCDLSFMLKAFKGTILDAISTKLKKHI